MFTNVSELGESSRFGLTDVGFGSLGTEELTSVGPEKWFAGGKGELNGGDE